ncbi:MAG: SMC-Scp complex subunit ScpB [Candidatus Zambryskibacteria bacterium]|nr:SMC-Scp complex subunit ScpB [Candidatus Zambryskibacteria bacterium]
MEQKIESILFYKNEPVSATELSEWLEVSLDEVMLGIESLKQSLLGRGVVLLENRGEYSLATAPLSAGLIEKIVKDELSKDLSTASLETLAVVIYKGPVTRKEIEYIRGVNVSFSLRNLLLRGLIEKVSSKLDERIFLYTPSIDALKYLGVTSVKELPGYEEVVRQLSDRTQTENTQEE